MADILPPSHGAFDRKPLVKVPTQSYNSQNQQRTSAKKQALIERLASASQEVAASVEEIAAAVEQSSKSSQMIATAAEEAGRSADTNRKAVTNLQVLIKNNFSSSKIVQETVIDITNKLNTIVRDIGNLNKSIEDSVGGIEASLGIVEVIENVAKEIEDAVSGIMKIADRTNLLALNAAIEAAKAGEHGMVKVFQ